MKRILLVAFAVLCLSGCQFFGSFKPAQSDPEVEADNVCPAELASRAFDFAKLYEAADTEYSWGGQDGIRSIKVDCSGLVVRCYQYALEDSDYNLLFEDTTSALMASTYSQPTREPRHGDLMFVGANGSDRVTHVGLVDRIENGYVYFIDANQIDTDHDGKYDGKNDINGVSERRYPTGSPYIKGYGKMLVKKR